MLLVPTIRTNLKFFLLPLPLLVACTILVQPNEFQKSLTESPSSPFTPAFNALVKDTLDYWHIPGLSIAIIDGNDTFTKVTLHFH